MSKENNKVKSIEKKPFYKQWWFWAIIVVLVFAGIGASGSNSNVANDNQDSQSTEQVELGKKYDLIGGVLGEYGRVVTLNKNTDMPVDKYLYKLPVGKYKVTTTNEKYSAFFIVKDEIGIEEGNADYPETLQYVGEGYMLTTSDDDLNGHAKKEVTITIQSDESILLTDNSNFITVQEIK